MTSLSVEDQYVREDVPEKRLLSAILLRTWADLDSSDRFIRNTSFYWIDLSETADWSFPWICEQLGLVPKQVKKTMLESSYLEIVQKLKPERYGKVEKTLLCYEVG